MSGCIIPVAPDFQDPVGSPNYSPYWYREAQPPFGTPFTITGSFYDFTVVASDPNLTDPLWVQWAIDYPPFRMGVTNAITGMMPVAPTPDGSRSFSLRVSCNLLLMANANSFHQLEVIVSDAEPAFHPNGPFNDVPEGRFAIQGDWTFYLPCDGTANPP